MQRDTKDKIGVAIFSAFVALFVTLVIGGLTYGVCATYSGLAEYNRLECVWIEKCWTGKDICKHTGYSSSCVYDMSCLSDVMNVTRSNVQENLPTIVCQNKTETSYIKFNGEHIITYDSYWFHKIFYGAPCAICAMFTAAGLLYILGAMIYCTMLVMNGA